MKKLILPLYFCFSVLLHLQVIAVQPSIDENNLIKNGHFDNLTLDSPDFWGFWSVNGGAAPVVQDGVAVCSPVASPNIWEYILYQTGIEALPNIPYIFSFRAWSDADRSIGVTFQDTPENNFNRYGSSSDPEANWGGSDWTLNISTVPTTYTLHVVFDKMVPSTIQYLQFMLNSTSDVVYIDDVSLISTEDFSGLKLSENKTSLDASEGSSTKLLLTTSASWTAASDQSWLSVVPSSGTGSQTLILTAKANNSISERTGRINVWANGITEPQTIVVTQFGSTAPINVDAGNLASNFTTQELASITKLTLVGTIDARDFKTMRDDMPLLAELDLSEVTIVAYNGPDGTSIWGSENYPADAIPEFAFMNSSWIGKNSLKTIEFPASLRSFGMYSFTNCNGLTSVSIPSMVTYIASNAFASCNGLTSVKIPSTVITIEPGAFTGCPGSIDVDPNNPNYSSIDGVLFNKAQTELIQFPTSKSGDYLVPSTVIHIGSFSFFNSMSLNAITLPEHTESINQAAFMGCSGLSSISIPSAVKSIESSAFMSCTGLNSIYTLNSFPVDLSTSLNVFNGVDQTNCVLKVPYGSKSKYQSASQWQDFTNIVEAPEGFGLSANMVSVAAEEGSTASINMTANVDWILSSDQTWLTVSPGSGNDNQILVFTAEANPSIISRVAKVTVSANGFQSQTITITQEAKVSVGLVGSFNQWGTSSSDVPFIQDNNNSSKWSLIYNFSNAEEVKFRRNNSWIINWGNSDFPSGIAIANGPNIPVPIGKYQINFNSSTGEYNFKAITIKCNQQDSLALVAIYNAANGLNWSRKDNWLTGNVSSWHGVTLNSQGRVTKLNLTRNGLSGTIPDEIGNLTELINLNLGNIRYVENNGNWNYFGGRTLPASVAYLINLEVFTLDGLQIQSELSDVFTGMNQLKELDLSYNYFINKSLPAGILNCTNLELLNVAINNFSSLPDLTGLTKLRQLQTQSNRLSFEDLEPNVSISGFSYWPQAKFGVAQAYNPETGSLFSRTLIVGGEHNQYQWYKDDVPLDGQISNTLSITNISMADAGIYHLRVTNSAVSNLTLYSEPITLYQAQLPVYQALKDFFESTGGSGWNNNNNWLSDAPIANWYGIYQNSDGKYTLQLNSNNLVGQLPENIGDLTLFYGIGIYDSPKLTGSIPSSIGNLSQLNWLYFENTGLGGDVPLSMVNLQNLSSLDLEYNSFISLPDFSTSNLQGLYIYNNHLEFDDIAPTLKGNPALWVEYAPQAKFGSSEVYAKSVGESLTLNVSVGGAGNLYQWYKDGNLLDGMTQNALVLSSVTLSDYGIYECKVTNPDVPDLTLESEPIYLKTIADDKMYKALEAFYASTGGPNWKDNTNWLTTEPISTWHGISNDADGLYTLNLDNNNLVGQLPSSLGDLTDFKAIHIPNNPNLTGEIPESIGNLKKLGYLALYNDQLGGSIPSAITSCTNLFSLYLTNNLFESLPDFSTKSLANLYVENNRLQFDDLAPVFNNKPVWFEYRPQHKFGSPENYTRQVGESFALTANVGGTGNLYQWYKFGYPIEGATDKTLVFDALSDTDGGSYVCMVTNPDVPNLTLESEPLNISIEGYTNSPSASVKKTVTSPVIDGTIDDIWNSANSYAINRAFTAENPTLGNSGTTTWKALWNDQGIYILVQVNDDVFSPAYAGTDPSQNWMYDKVEIYFDVNQDRLDGFGAGTDGNGNGSGHYQFAPTFIEAQIGGGVKSDAGSNGAIFSFKVTNPDYIGEYFIPFSKLIDKNGIEVDRNAVIGFDITVADNDITEPSRNRAVWSNTGQISECWSNMDDAGTITLEGSEPAVLITNVNLADGTIDSDNGTLQMVADILPENATNKHLKWSVENGTGRAMIDETTGLLTALTDGIVTVRANTKDGSNLQAVAIITITDQLVQIEDIDLIKNGNFIYDGGLPGFWGWYSGNGGIEPKVVDGVAICSPVMDPDTYWQYQFNQTGLEALPNTDYILSFSAWADADRQIAVDFEDTPENNYNRYGSSPDQESIAGRSEWIVAITTVPTTYTFHVNFDQILPTTLQKIQFMLSASPEIVYIDQVRLVAVEDLKLINHAPVANAGTDLVAKERSIVKLTAFASSDSDGDLLTYHWVAPEGIILNSNTAVNPTFTAPSVMVDTDLIFKLIVNDGLSDSQEDQVIVKVIQIDAVPVANAGPDQTVLEGDLVTLNAISNTNQSSQLLKLKQATIGQKAFTESDTYHCDIDYHWASPVDFSMDKTTITRLTFSGPETITETDHVISLEISDGSSIENQQNDIKFQWPLPAGIKLSPTVCAQITIVTPKDPADRKCLFSLLVYDGSVSNVPNNNTQVYVYVPPTEIPLVATTIVKLSVETSEATPAEEYTYSMLVYDGTVTSDPNKVPFVYLSIPPTPIQLSSSTTGKLTIIAPDNQTEPNYNFAVQVCSGSESPDPNDPELTYRWTAPEGIILSSATGASTTFVAPEVDADTDYIFSLVTNNGLADSEADQIVVTVKNGNNKPVAYAGADQVVNEGGKVTLDGNASYDPDNDALTYSWTSLDGIELSSVSDPVPTFYAPEVNEDKEYIFSLMVSDGMLNSEIDYVVVTVKQVHKNPVANAGQDQSVKEGTLVTLDGTHSIKNDGLALTYKWTAPDGIVLNNESDGQPNFKAPQVSFNTPYTISLVVNDGQADSQVDEVIINVLQVNNAPVANAGKNQLVKEGEMVTLNGSGSFDSDGDMLTYKWSAPDGIVLNSETEANPTFIAPEVNADKPYILTLVVNDGTTDSAPSEVEITVKDLMTTLNLVSKVNNVPIPPDEVTYQLYLKTDDTFILQNLDAIEDNESTKFYVFPGEWIVLASPVSDSYDFIPTYAGDVMNWVDAEPIQIADKSITNKEINCIAPEVGENGIGEISGYVFENTDGGNKSLSITKSDDYLSGNAINGVLIHLFRLGGTYPVASVFTDLNGFYKFDQLQISDYEIVVEIPGFLQSERFRISMSENDPSVSVKFQVNSFSKTITDVNAMLLFSVKIYPNPTKGKVQLKFSQNVEFGTWISVFDTSGRLILKSMVDNPEKSINLEGNPAGLYFIKIDQKMPLIYKLILE